MLEKIRQLVKNEADEDDWDYHLVPVVNYAKKLAKLLKADEEVTELAALLHDIGRLRFSDEDHDITGVPEAEKILKEHGYPQKVIDEVKHCVESHRSSKNISPKTTIAKIIANADAMAHFDILPVFFYWRCKKSNFKEAFTWVDEKIERDWNKKLTLPEAKNMMKEKYQAIKLILDSNRRLISLS
ncbi:MAG TPA: HD domain-containing protein [Candidatus Nanoarchaeia archaeon]|nr:HD domain-containing protein [Candidatus Nanoarchaeia archaeon]